uniref:NADH-ubiquinone oxidoreductase chain 5 n=1 Tax=Corynis lateralis TaxID=1983417 RepID=A0A1W6Q583_9HYME|nr:NADH dehydrogenase subunit 5 [Corynis lateralis]
MIFLDLCIVMFFFLLFFSFLFFFTGMLFVFKNLYYFIEFNIFSLNSSSIIMILLIDWKSLFFMSTVLFISSFVIFYSKEYMLNDLNLIRFILLILLFIFSMMLLILSPNLISILLGWDGLGLISYCLVIYYQNVKSFNAGMLTVLSNRIGDVSLLMAISWMLNYGSWTYLFYLDFMTLNIISFYIILFVLLASFTKSAQIPFSAWLPAAMAAPTPVSSLVHSSTLVTAGVYLLIRFENLLNSIFFIKWFLFFSVLTMFMSGLNANFEFDLKKIIALSTLSQLGMMMSILFLGYGNLAFFHLLIHAFFKALLFMCAGIYIHNLFDMQDIRYLGSLFNQMPLVSICFNFSNLALCGFPFLSGFYSKDLILEVILYLNFNFFIMFFLMISTLFTVMYTFRLIFFSMLSKFNFFSLNCLISEFNSLNKSLLGLMGLVIFSGSMIMWLIFPIPLILNLPFYFKFMPIFLILMGFILSLILYFFKKLSSMNLYLMYFFFSSMWFLPIISTNFFSKNILFFGMNMNFFIDQGWSETFMGRGLMKFICNLSFLDLLIYYFGNMLNLFLIFIFFILFLMFY